MNNYRLISESKLRIRVLISSLIFISQTKMNRVLGMVSIKPYFKPSILLQGSKIWVANLLLLILSGYVQAQTCCTTEIFAQPGLESTETMNTKFPNATITTTNNAAGFLDHVITGGWNFDDGAASGKEMFRIRDASRASEGSEFIYLPFINGVNAYNYCIQAKPKITYSTGTTCTTAQMIIGRRYILAFDYVPFNQDVPAGGTGSQKPAHEIYDASGTQISTSIAYNISGAPILYETAVSWADVKTSWKRAYFSVVIPTGSDSFYASSMKDGTCGMLMDNLSVKELTMTASGIGAVTCDATQTKRVFTLNPTSNVGGVPGLKYNVTAPSGYAISPTQGTYGQATTFTLTKTTGSAIGTGSLAITLTDGVNTYCSITGTVADATCAAACTSPTITATPTLCVGSTSNTYTLQGSVSFTNPPTTGTLTVSVQGGQSQVFTAPFTSPLSYTISNLYADGTSRTVTASFSAASCSSSKTYTAPASVGTGLASFPLNSSISSITYDGIPVYYEAYVTNLHYPVDSPGGQPKYPGLMDLDIQPQGLTNYTGYCVEKAQSIPSISTNAFTVQPLEVITRGLAGVTSNQSINIPTDGIGRVRAGMVRYLIDNYLKGEYLSNTAWTNDNAAALAMALIEVTHEVYTSNNSFTLKTASTNGYYYVPTPAGTVSAAVDLGETYLQAINALNWTDEQWMSYQSTKYHVIALESTNYQDVIVPVPIVCTTVCTNPTPTVNSPTICSGQTATLTVSNCTGTVTWSGGLTGNPATTPALTANTTYTATCTVGTCTGTATATVTVTPNPAPTVNSPTICSGQTATLTVSNCTGTVTWSGGLTGNPATTPALTSNTTYTATCTVGTCTGTATATVTVTPNPAPTVNSPTICSGQTATLTVSNCTGTVTWSGGLTGNPATTPALTANTTYTATCTVGTCTGTATATVTVTPNPAPTVNSPTICSGQTATLTVANCTGTVTWSGGLTGNPATTPALTSNTTYTATCTVGTCTGTATATVTVTPNPAPTVNSPTICSGQTATLTVSNCTGTVTWSGGLTGNPATTPALTSNTTYTATCTVGTCTGTAVATVTVTPNPAPTVNSPTICSGQTATLTVANCTGTVTWSGGLTGNPATTPALTSNTTYTATCTVGTCTGTATAIVTVTPNLAPTVNSPTICSGQTATLTVSNCTGTVTWSGGLTGNPATTPALTSNTTYTATCTVGTCTGTATATVTVNPKPNAGPDQTLACANATTNTLTTSTTLVPNPTGGTYTQIGTTPATATITGNNVTNMTVAGTYQFQYNVAGCLDTVAVTVQPCAGCAKPDAGSDAAAVCQPTTTAKLTAVTTGGTWAPIVSPANPSAATIDANGNITGLSAAGTYKFVYSVMGGGETCTDTAQVVVNAKPVIADGTATICAGETVDLTSKITSYSTLLSPVWTVATADGTAVTTPTAVKPAVTTTYVLVAQNAAGCKDTANVVVTVSPKPYAGKDSTLACADATTNTLTTAITLVPSPTGGTYTQIGTTPATATITGNNVTNMTVVGTYQFQYSVAGCLDTVAVTVESCIGCVKPNAGPDAAAVCQPTTTAKLTAVTTGGTWAPIVSPANPSAATIDANGNITGLSAAGTYKFVYSVMGGGETCTDTAQVVVNAKPVIADGTATICAGETVDLTSKITSYSTLLSPVWTVATAGGTAVTTPTAVKPAITTTYVLVAQNVAGCKDTANVVVTVNPKPYAGKDSTLACADATTNTLTTAITLVPNPTGGTYTQIGTTPATATITGNDVTGMTVAGTYQFVYTTTAGCKDTVAVTVESCIGCVKPNAGLDAAAVCQPTTTAKLTAVTTGGTWAPIGSPANPSAASIDASGNITGLSAVGTYKFVYSVMGGGETCTDTAQVVVNAKPVIADGAATICAGETVDLTSKITSYSTLLSPVWTVATVDGTAVTTPTAVKPAVTTTYVLVAQNAAGCKDTANVVVMVSPKPYAGKDSTLACADATTNTLTTAITLVPNPTGGTYTQIGTTPAAATITGNNVTNMTVAGTYQFVYMTTAGCKDTVAVTVSPCIGCVKPNAGPDITLTCPTSGIAPTTATLAPVTTGGTWSAQTGNPETATVTGNDVTGMTVSGTYKFIYSVTGGGETCTDTVAVIVPTCVQPKGSIGDYVWKDQNNNGLQDTGEPAQSGIIVQLLSSTGAVLATDTTDSNGLYLFSNLSSGTYQVKISTASLPAGCTLSTKQNVGTDDKIDSDFDPTTGLSQTVTIDALGTGIAKDNMTVDGGLYSPKGSIGDYVWKDQNNNGLQDTGEPAQSGVIVQLLSSTGAVLATDTTDSNGLYLFSNLSSGTYQVKILTASLPAGCTLSTKQNVGTDDKIDSDFDPTTGLSQTVTIDATGTGIAKDNMTIDGGLYSPKGSIGDYVWKDQNNNGLQDTGEPAQSGIIVQLLSSTGAVLATDTTDSNGLYLFSNLSSGTYQVKILTASLPAGCTLSTKQNVGTDDKIDSDFDPTTGLSQTVTIDATGTGIAKDNMTVDGALYSPKGSIGDYVWKDQNNNGLQDTGEPAQSGVIVQLLSSTGAVLATDTTDSNGLYLFSNLSSGTYQVKISTASLPAGCTLSTKQNVGTDDKIDSDFDPTTGLSQTVTIDALGTGIAKDNMTIDGGLYSPKGSIGDYVWKDQNNNGLQDTGEPAQSGIIVQLLSSTGAVLATDTTDSNGLYLFSNLSSGTYQVKISIASLPAGCTLSTKQNVGTDDKIDSDFDPTTGLSQTVTIDALGTGIAKDNMTVDGGLYSPKGSIGDYVWKDQNNNGLQDTGEPAQSGVIVQLLSSTGAVLATDTTDSNGLYLFSNLSSGTYQVKISTASLPAGCTLSTKQNVGTDDKIDSDFDPTTGLSQTVTIDATGTGITKDNMTVDGGLYSPKGSIGDYVWKDQNNNGLQDTGEPAQSGIIVQLLSSTGAVLATDTTDSNGLYLFSNLSSGTYQVKISTASLPAGCTLSTKQNVGTDDKIDSDFDPTTGLSQTVTIDALGTGDAKDNMTIDAALYTPCVKPFAGTDQQLVCSGTTQITTATLAATAVTGGSWSQIGTTPSVATITNVTLANSTITGLVPGTYKFVWSTKTDCSDTVSVFVPNCGCVSTPPLLIGGNPQVCIGDTFPTLKVSIVGTGTVDWYSVPTGGIAVSTNSLTYKPTGNVTTTVSFYAQAKSTDPTCPAVSQRTMITVDALNCIDTVDLALKKLISKKLAQVGDVIDYTIKVWNESDKNATGVAVTDNLNVGVQYLSSTATRGSYDIGTKKWTIGDIAANGDTVTLTITVKVLAEGVWFNTAQISNTNEKDIDSTPGNGVDGEDDIDRQCFSVPIKLCSGQAVDVRVPINYTGIVWKDIQGNIVPSSGNLVTFTKAGTYSFTATNGSCPAGGCCPVIIEEINCCPAEVCVPFVIKKTKGKK